MTERTTQFLLDNKAVLVTGGGTGIGRAIALGAAEAGARVAIVGRRGEPLREVQATAMREGLSLQIIQGDVGDPNSVMRFMSEAVEALGGLDGVVCAAGVHRRGPSEELEEDDLLFILNVDLIGAYRVNQYAGRLMLRQGSGSILNIGSIASLGGFPGRLAYSMSKGGLLTLTQTLAVEWASRGVRVNLLAPGFVATAISSDRSESELRDLLARIPLGRRGLPEEMVGPGLFLLSDAASFVTGHCLVADGGWISNVAPVDRWSQYQ